MAQKITGYSEDTNIENMDRLNEQLVKLEKSADDTTWAQADIYLEAKQNFGLHEFAKATKRIFASINVYANVAEEYPALIRIRGSWVTFSHHRVAMSNPARMEWLRKADEGHWSVERLKHEMNPPKLPSPIKDKELKPVTKEAEPKPNFVEEIVPITAEEPKSAFLGQTFTFENMVASLNYYYYKERSTYDAFADIGTLLQKLFNDDRNIVFDNNQFKIRELDGSLSEHMYSVYDR